MPAHAGRVGSAFAAELGTMAVSEQTDSLRVLGSDPVDYLITPRTLACMIAGPILNLMCFVMGELLHSMASATLLLLQPSCSSKPAVAGEMNRLICQVKWVDSGV